MKAMQLQSYGETPDFRLADIPAPVAGPGEVLIRVAATSVNPVDIKMRTLKPPFAPALPAVFGMDVAGTVEAVGEGVAAFKPGDEVFGCAGGLGDLHGALAELMPADARLLAKKPTTLTMAEAAALPLVTITAWEALFDRAGLEHGQHVLVHAGTGGVGHVAVQLAKAAGARVAATVSGDEKARLASSLGADEIVNYRQEDVPAYVQRLTGGEGFDVVFDTVGGANLDLAIQAAKIMGVVASTNTRSTHDLSQVHAKGLTLTVVFMLLPLITGKGRARHGQIMAQAAELAELGKLRPVIARTFHMTDIAEAHGFLASGKAVGKVVVTVG